MSAVHAVVSRSAWVLAALVAASGCSTSTPEIPVAGFRPQAHQIISLAAERDSLIREVSENTKLVSDIAVELAKIEVKNAAGSPESAELRTTLNDRDFVREKIREVTARVKESETKLAASQRRVRQLTKLSDSLSDGLAYHQSVATQLQAVVENQKATIDLLSNQVEVLATRNSALTDTVNTLTAKNSLAYYVIGNRKELLSKGLVAEEGSRFPIFGKKALVPARELPLGEFTSIDTRVVGEIPLPDSTRKYRIISRQNLVHLADSTDRKGTISRSIRIASASGFWEPSRYLIVVEQ